MVDSTSAYPDVDTQNWLQSALHLKYVSGFDKRDHFTHFAQIFDNFQAVISPRPLLQHECFLVQYKYHLQLKESHARSLQLFVAVIRALGALPFSENCRAIKNPANLASYLPSGKAQRFHLLVIAAATPPA